MPVDLCYEIEPTTVARTLDNALEDYGAVPALVRHILSSSDFCDVLGREYLIYLIGYLSEKSSGLNNMFNSEVGYKLLESVLPPLPNNQLERQVIEDFTGQYNASTFLRNSTIVVFVVPPLWYAKRAHDIALQYDFIVVSNDDGLTLQRAVSDIDSSFREVTYRKWVIDLSRISNYQYPKRNGNDMDYFTRTAPNMVRDFYFTSQALIGLPLIYSKLQAAVAMKDLFISQARANPMFSSFTLTTLKLRRESLTNGRLV